MIKINETFMNDLHPSSNDMRIEITMPKLVQTALLATLMATALCTLAQAQTAPITTEYKYDDADNLTQIIDPLGRVTEQEYDGLNRLKKQTQPAPAVGVARPVIGYDYDGQDQLTTVTDPRNLATNYTVNGLGDRTKLASPDTGGTANTYDDAGRLQTSTDARGKVTTYTYGKLNRLLKISYTSGTPTVFEYGDMSSPPSARGRLTSMTDESGQTTYTYNARGAILSKVQTVGTGTTAKTFTLSYTYGTSGSSLGKMTSMTYPSGNRINYGYDAAGRINDMELVSDKTDVHSYPPPATKIVTSVTTKILTNITYSPFGQVQAWTWGNSTPTNVNTYARGFDLAGRITSYPLGNAVYNGIYRTITYDAASRITGITHSGMGTGNNAPANFNQSYGYDNLDRLISYTSGNTSHSFQYDATGNRTQLNINGTNYNNTIDPASNKLTAASGPTPAKTDSYDAAGNLNSDGSITYTYSDRGRMKSATRAGGYTNTYLYNGLGQRVMKYVPGPGPGSTYTYYYVYDEQGHLLIDNGPNVETVYLGDLPVAVVKYTLPPSGYTYSKYMSVYNIYADHLNTPRVITNPNNLIVWQWNTTDPFGMLPPIESAANMPPIASRPFVYNLRFPGQVWDQETNLFYNYFRYYDPQGGRYIQSDPVGLLGGVNTYIYVENNPLRIVDPFGLWGLMGPDPSKNTLVCNGKGGIKVQIGPMSKAQKDCGIADCAKEHEESHIADAMAKNPGVCGGFFFDAPADILVGAQPGKESRESEYKAYGVTISCLKKKLMCTDPKCKALIELNISNSEAMRNYFK